MMTVRPALGQLPLKPSANSPALIIELVGPAGVGKTTLLKALEQSHASLSTYTPVSKTDYCRFFLNQGSWLVPNRLTYRSKVQRLSWEEIRSMVYLDAWYRKLVTGQNPEKLDRAKPVAVLDHGPIFRLAKLREFGAIATHSQSYQRWWQATSDRWLNALNVIVLLDAPDEILIERVLNRPDWHLLKEKAPTERIEFLSRYRRIYKQLIQATADQPTLKILHFDTSQQSAEDISQLLLHKLALSAQRS